MKNGGTFKTEGSGSTLRYLFKTDNYIDYFECLVNFPIHCYNTKIVAKNSRYSLNLVIKKLPQPEFMRNVYNNVGDPETAVQRCS